MTGTRRIQRLLCASYLVVGLCTVTRATTFSIKPVMLNPRCAGVTRLRQACVQHSDCDSFQNPGDGLCLGTPLTFTCLGGANSGAPCSRGSDCDSYTCGSHVGRTVTHVTTCQGGPHDGEPCNDTSECESEPGLRDGVCAGDYEIWAFPEDVIVTELYGADWSPNNDDEERVRLWQFKIDTNGFVNEDCPGEGVFPVGWDRPRIPQPCTSDADCPREYPVCNWLAICVGPDHEPERGFFIDGGNPNYIFHGLSELPAVDYLGWRAASTILQPGVEPLYGPPPKYLATLALEVSANPCGTYTIPFVTEGSGTMMQNPRFVPLLPIVTELLIVNAGETLLHCLAQEPENCTIDARQPHEPDGSSPTGWDSVLLQCMEDDDFSSLTKDEFAVRRVPSNPPTPFDIDHIEVDDVDKTITIVFTRPVDPGRWTCVEYRPRSQEFCLGYLPGDVTNDRATALNDIAALINHLNGDVVIPAEEFYRCDIDRSGDSSSADLLRLIDVLTGGDAYDRWLDFDGLRVCPSRVPVKRTRPLGGMGH